MKKDNTIREILEMKAKIGGKGKQKKKTFDQARSLAAAIA